MSRLIVRHQTETPVAAIVEAAVKEVASLADVGALDALAATATAAAAAGQVA